MAVASPFPSATGRRRVLGSGSSACVDPSGCARPEITHGGGRVLRLSRWRMGLLAGVDLDRRVAEPSASRHDVAVLLSWRPSPGVLSQYRQQSSPSICVHQTTLNLSDARFPALCSVNAMWSAESTWCATPRPSMSATAAGTGHAHAAPTADIVVVRSHRCGRRRGARHRPSMTLALHAQWHSSPFARSRIADDTLAIAELADTVRPQIQPNAAACSIRLIVRSPRPRWRFSTSRESLLSL
jgi:hypothetical protein